MKISTQQLEKVLKGEGNTLDTAKVDEAVIRLTDSELIQKVKDSVKSMPDRDAMVAELKAKIEAGQYNPSGDDIADTMIRRTIADRIR